MSCCVYETPWLINMNLFGEKQKARIAHFFEGSDIESCVLLAGLSQPTVSRRLVYKWVDLRPTFGIDSQPNSGRLSTDALSAGPRAIPGKRANFEDLISIRTYREFPWHACGDTDNVSLVYCDIESKTKGPGFSSYKNSRRLLVQKLRRNSSLKQGPWTTTQVDLVDFPGTVYACVEEGAVYMKCVTILTSRSADMVDIVMETIGGFFWPLQYAIGAFIEMSACRKVRTREPRATKFVKQNEEEWRTGSQKTLPRNINATLRNFSVSSFSRLVVPKCNSIRS